MDKFFAYMSALTAGLILMIRGCIMPSNEQHEDVLRRLDIIERRIYKAEKAIAEQDKADLQVSMEMHALRQDFISLRGDVLETLKTYTERTWQLVDGSVKLIVILVILVVAITTGLKFGPELLKFF